MLQIEQPQVGAALIDDAAIGKRGRLHVKAAMVRVLFQIVAVLVHRVDVHDAVAVGKKIDAAIPEHGVVRGAGLIAGQSSRLPEPAS